MLQRLLFLTLSSVYLDPFSLDGKKESTATGALSTSTTVRPRCFLSTSPLNHLLTSLSSLLLPFVWRTDECVLSYLCPDTKNTQWEDPRLQSPAITGPVSSLCYFTYLPPAPASLYDTVEPLCCCHLTCRNSCVVCMDATQLMLWGHNLQLYIQLFFPWFFCLFRPFPTPGSLSKNTTTSGRS